MVASHRRQGRRPWVMVNMVTSLDGATTVEGRSGELGDPDDQALFRAFRAVADVIMVGAATVRTEGYGPVLLSDEVRRRRVEWGLEALPRLAVVSGRLDIDPDSRFLDPDRPPLIITGADHSPQARSALRGKAEVVALDGSRPDPPGWIEALGEVGIVLCEGGPSINGQLAEADLIDELNITTAPIVVGGQSARLAHSVAELTPPRRFRLDRLLAGDRMLFARYLRDRS